MTMSQFAHAFQEPLSLDRLAEKVPAAFAEHAAAHTGPKYVFISTRELVSALLDAGFVATQASQTAARGGNVAFARHMLRFQPQVQTVSLRDALPQIVLINSHDGRSAYQLRAALFRPVCTNGLLTPIGDFGLIHVAHRGNVVRNVVEAALRITQAFSRVGDAIERMIARSMTEGERLSFAADALALRFTGREDKPVLPAQLLETRRIADQGDDLWHTFNVVQENVMRGGISGRSAHGRAMRTRAIRAIREDVRINSGLWKLALDRTTA